MLLMNSYFSRDARNTQYQRLEICQQLPRESLFETLLLRIKKLQAFKLFL